MLTVFSQIVEISLSGSKVVSKKKKESQKNKKVLLNMFLKQDTYFEQLILHTD